MMQALHRIATAIAALAGVVAAIAAVAGVVLYFTNAGEWANDYWFNPYWLYAAVVCVAALIVILLAFAMRGVLRLVSRG